MSLKNYSVERVRELYAWMNRAHVLRRYLCMHPVCNLRAL